MPIWKQALITVAVVAIALTVWLRFVPGAAETLARLGIDWVPFAIADTRTDNRQAASGNGGGQSGPQAGVVGSPVTRETINDRLSAIGTGRAKQSVVVTPYASGRMTEVLVESGAQIETGQPIARLDAETEAIAVDRARVALEDAQARQTRVAALRTSNTVSAVQLTEAELAVQNARLALRDAELALDRRSILAPISGVVGILPIAAGNYVGTSSEIARIDDRSEILIDFWVPERYAAMINVGDKLAAMSVARPDQVFEGVVSALDNRIDEQSRTLQVQARVTNPQDMLRAGMSFQVTLRFPGDTYVAVDPLAVQWGADGAFVWKVENGVGKRTPVRIIQRNTDTVLLDAALAEGDVVVIEGIHVVREGAPVNLARIEGRNMPAASAEAASSGT